MIINIKHKIDDVKIDLFFIEMMLFFLIYKELN